MTTETLRPTQPIDIPFIRLKGEPYQRTLIKDKNGVVEFIDCSQTLGNLALSTGYLDRLPQMVDRYSPHMETLFQGEGYYDIDRKLKHGQNLTFDEAFSLGAFVCSALNRPLEKALAHKGLDTPIHETRLLQATALFSAMSAKESYAGLTAEEIAGMVAATISLDTVERTKAPDNIVAFGGMGGDRGYTQDGIKTKFFSLSTLSAVALATETPVHKHHSYPNTSKVAGQSAIEAFGARSDFHTSEAFKDVIEETNLMMSSCHDIRTLHTLSHLLKGETINHVIGPLAFTLAGETQIQAMIGVNEKIHPSTIIDSLKILSDRSFQGYGNSVAYCGTDLVDLPLEMLDEKKYNATPAHKEHVMIDEIAPPPYQTIASFLVDGENAGTYILSPEDFYSEGELEDLSIEQLAIPNDVGDILRSNLEALTGKDEAKKKYLAMTIGLGLFVRNYLGKPDALYPNTHRVNSDYLRFCTRKANQILESGRALAKLQEYVAATNKFAGIQK